MAKTGSNVTTYNGLKRYAKRTLERIAIAKCGRNCSVRDMRTNVMEITTKNQKRRARKTKTGLTTTTQTLTTDTKSGRTWTATLITLTTTPTTSGTIMAARPTIWTSQKRRSA